MTIKKTSSFWIIASIFFAMVASAAERQVLHGHVPEAVARLHLRPTGLLPATKRLHLIIGLPLRNKQMLTNLLEQLDDPTSTNYHRYLTPQQFTERFGPTEQDYERVVNFAKANRLDVKNTYSDRVVLEVEAPVSSVESAFHVTLQTYLHPTEARQFFVPDVEPSVDIGLPGIFISGLNNFYIPHPMSHRKPAFANGQSLTGSASDGSFIGEDFRNAYVPGVTLNGSGQMVGLVEFEGYYTSDITAYENLAQISPNVPLQNVVLPDFSMKPSDIDGILECSLDIEMVACMAPGLSTLYVFEGNTADQILNSMVSYTNVKQFSCSWGMGYDSTAEGYLMQMKTQNQTFFMASGDGDAWIDNNMTSDWPCDDIYVTSTGGTELTMNGSGASYNSETVWNSGSLGFCNGWFGNPDECDNTYWGSGGGVSTTYGMPPWQNSTDTTVGGGRNIPDVAMVADDVWVNYNHTTLAAQEEVAMGTSIAAPLWAGFTALVNQNATEANMSNVGFLNPAIYTIGNGANYLSCFHDITTGNNTWSESPSEFYAGVGYDLCTGWGSPNGMNSINLLSGTTRIISVTGNLDFGNVQEGTTAQRTLTIWSEGGNANLDVSSISYPSGFSGAWSGTVWLDGSVNVTVTFSPTEITSYGGTVTVSSDASSGANTISASGTGISTPPPPVSPFPIAPFSVVYSFPYSPGPWAHGANPQAGLVQGSDGNFYGTTTGGGSSDSGVVFRLTPSGINQPLYSFPEGNAQPAPLIQATDSNFYGTTRGGGTEGEGSIFKITSSGAFTLLYSFGYSTDDYASIVRAPLIQATDGYLYGTAQYGGEGPGLVFRISTSGTLSVIHQFANINGNDTTEGGFSTAPLVQGNDGNFYGTTGTAGTNNCGTIFRMTPAGNLTVFYSFTGGADGRNSGAGLVQGKDGSFYGITSAGGMYGYGTVFKVTTNGMFTTLHSFTGGTDGTPAQYGNCTVPPLIQATDGNLYGTTFSGGAFGEGDNGNGTVFQITTNGALTTLYSFCGQPDGANPWGGLVQGRDGNLYGTTYEGGTDGGGVVFCLVIPVGLESVTQTSDTITISWNSIVGQIYQVQYVSDLTSTNWTNLTSQITAATGITTVSDAIVPSQQRFYRVVEFPQAW
jgi:uncharacterized repeat protein (TIGR03803 family)